MIYTWKKQLLDQGDAVFSSKQTPAGVLGGNLSLDNMLIEKINIANDSLSLMTSLS
ncbi:hypothetical protein phytr_10750 [Candidatus Phycorickettsia trachydisci]|uniref:Uncharacterized protein n=1 Tax=Candidatus Phycorickettsia trachydisci TaxID=2115978 RepID=A0A2P1P9P8_9RICK|nr:hypothetical protein [Candidatus Phycorickettsia trachydisci]AVP88002.1 hypothetical protein phytr_10750 [Candidatus Phycorickettsia trachydisci]